MVFVYFSLFWIINFRQFLLICYYSRWEFCPLFCLIYLSHFGKILLTIKLGSIYYDYVSFLVQLCFMRKSLMLRCFCLLVGFSNIYCSVFSHPFSAVFHKVDHSGQLSGFLFCCLTWKLPSWCPVVLLQFRLVALLASQPAVILELFLLSS